MEFKRFVEATSPGSNIDKLIGICLMSSGFIHSKHFATKSYAHHKTYDDFYKEMPEKVDRFVETYLGTREYIEQLPNALPESAVELLQSIITLSEGVYEELSHAEQSLLDDIVSLCRQTLYLLKLK